MRTVAAGRHRGLTLSVLAVAVSAFSLMQSLVVPVLPTFQREFDTDQATVTWVLTAYLVTASVAAPVLGRIGDVVGKRRMLVITLGVLALGSVLSALAPGIGWLIAARAVAGVGGAVIPLSFGLARDTFGESPLGALAVLAALGSGGFAAGIVLAGPVVDALGPTALFWLPGLAVVLAAVAAQGFVTESATTERARLPLLPGILLGGWLVTLLLALTQGNRWGWGSPGTVGLLAAAAAGAAAWVWAEGRAPVPMIDLQMMRRRGVWTANVVTLLMGFAMFASYGFLPQMLQVPPEAGYGFGASVTQAGWLLAPSSGASFVVGFLTAYAIRAVGDRVVLVAGSMLVAVSLVVVAARHDRTWELLLATTVQGIGIGLLVSTLAGVVITAVPAHQTGVAAGMNANLRTLGGAIGSAVMASVVTAHPGALGFPAEGGYVAGFVLLAGAMLLAAAVGLLVPGASARGGVPVQDDDRTGTPEAGQVAPGDRVLAAGGTSTQGG